MHGGKQTKIKTKTNIKTNLKAKFLPVFSLIFEQNWSYFKPSFCLSTNAKINFQGFQAEYLNNALLTNTLTLWSLLMRVSTTQKKNKG